MILDHFPRVSLAHLPTPLEPMERLSAALGGPRLLVKRDDCTGLATGGNKARKLEYLMADALARGADTVLTVGAVQSNHARQSAAAAARLGFGCHLLFEQRVTDAPDVYASSGNVFLDHLLGASVEVHPAGADMGAAMDAAAARLRRQGRRPYLIPGGGSNALGALGYVLAVEELLAQARVQGERIDHILVASGSSGTHVGLVTGLARAGVDIPVHGICVRFDAPTQVRRVYGHVEETADLLGLPAPPRQAVIAVDDYIGSGYGYPTPGMVEAVRLAARTEGLLLDPVYTGKAMHGLVELVSEGLFARNETVLFLHTGGAASLPAYEWAFAAD